MIYIEESDSILNAHIKIYKHFGYEFLNNFNNKDFDSHEFIVEMGNKLIKTYLQILGYNDNDYNNPIINWQIRSLIGYTLNIYMVGKEIGKGKDFKEYIDDYLDYEMEHK